MFKSYLSIIVFALVCSTSFSQQQISNSILGTGADALLGTAVAISENGETVVVGAPSDINSMEPGYVKVFRISGMRSWRQIGSTLSGANAGDLFGQSVDISADGKRIAVGVMHDDSFLAGANDNRGSVKVYDLIENDWVLVGNPIFGNASQDWSGAAVSLSREGRTLAVGSPMSDEGGSNSGLVKVYSDRDGVWTQVGNDIKQSGTDLFFGTSLELDQKGMNIVVGAPGFDGTGLDRGAVRVYRLTDGDWSPVGTGIAGATDAEMLGNAVSISANGKRIACASSNFDDGTGSVVIAEYADGGWIQIGQKLIGDDKSDFFGSSVALSADGNDLAIGIANDSDEQANGGQVRLYSLASLQSDWELTGNPVHASATGQSLGHAVDISAAGTHVIMGSPTSANDSNTPSDEPGMAQVYKWSPEIEEPLDVPVKVAAIELYPNPASNYVNVIIDDVEDFYIEVTDYLGKVLIREWNAELVDLQSLDEGQYIIRMVDEIGNSIDAESILIQR